MIIDPIAFSLGGFNVYWYGIAYMVGISLAWVYLRQVAQKTYKEYTAQDIDDFMALGILGIVIGGRLGQVFFYDLAYFMQHPLEIFIPFEKGDPFHGKFTGLRGMSFHGGLLGVVFALIYFTRKHRFNFFRFSDMIIVSVPIGLFFGRIANFINGELWGRKTDFFLGVVFPNVDAFTRHPSQLYEALGEGLLLFLLLFWLSKKTKAPLYLGFISGTFLLGYGIARILAEFVREPDDVFTFLGLTITEGQGLSIPMVAVGLVWMLRAKKA